MRTTTRMAPQDSNTVSDTTLWCTGDWSDGPNEDRRDCLCDSDSGSGRHFRCLRAPGPRRIEYLCLVKLEGTDRLVHADWSRSLRSKPSEIWLVIPSLLPSSTSEDADGPDCAYGRTLIIRCSLRCCPPTGQEPGGTRNLHLLEVDASGGFVYPLRRAGPTYHWYALWTGWEANLPRMITVAQGNNFQAGRAGRRRASICWK